MGWKPSDKIAVALFNFDAQNEQQLSVHVGDLLYILEEAPGWYRGYIYYEPLKKGVFPTSFVHVKDHTTARNGDTTVVVPAEDVVALEATQCLREWRTRLKELYRTGPREKYRQLLHFMDDVLNCRRNLLHSSATQDALQEMRSRLTARIDLINTTLGCPQTPRDERGLTVDCHDVSMQKLARLHKDRKAEIERHVSQTGDLLEKVPSAPTSHVHHLYFQVDYVDHQFPEDCEIFFFLYDQVRGRQITERFGMPWERRREKSKFHEQENHSAVFTDLGTKDIQATEMFLVCQIIRKGKMLIDDRKHVSNHRFRRPYALGVLDVTSVMQDQRREEWIDDEECHFSLTMPLYICSTNHESDFSTFHTSIIRKTGGKGGQKPGCAIAMSLRVFHGDLQQLKLDFPVLLTKEATVVHKLGFPDVILPGDVRNDIYVTVESGQFEKGSKRAERNVEVAVCVIDGQGDPIPRAILLGAGMPPLQEYESFVYYHDNNPKWNEIFKLSIPLEKLPDAHLRVMFRHVAKNEPKDKADKTFAFAYLKIMNDDGSIIQDGRHELYVYKADNKRWWTEPKIYLHQASCKEDILTQRSQRALTGAKGLSDAPNVQLSRSFKELIHVSTLTCSTKLTQKIELLMLLKWRQKERDLSVVLKNLTGIDGEEMVKFLQDTLDCLFDILNTNSDKYGELVFNALVSIFGLLSDDRYQHFTTVLDIYISKHFSAILAYRFLLRFFRRNIQQLGTATDSHNRLSMILKSMQYIFRFMVQSHTLYIRHNNRQDPTFKVDIQQAIGSLSTLMGHQESQVKGIHRVQSVLLQKMPLLFTEVVQIFSESETAYLVSHFLDSIRNMHDSVPGDKLTFILSVLSGPLKLLASLDARKCIVPTLVSHLISYMEHLMPRSGFSPELSSNRDCIACVAKLLEVLCDRQLGVSEGEVEMVVPLLHPLLRMCKQIPRTNDLAPLNLVNFVGLLDLMHDQHYAMLFVSLKSTIEKDLKDFVLDVMTVLEVVLADPPYPKDWVTLYFLQNRIIARVLQNTSKCLLEGFLNNTNFTPQIWDRFFALCTRFVTQPCLQLEKFSELRKLQYTQQFGDMRLSVGRLVVVLWHSLSDKKGNFIPNLIGSFLEISLVRHTVLRRVTLPLIVDIMKCEQLASGNFKRVETEVFDKMDSLVSNQCWGDEEYNEMFHDLLRQDCTKSTELEKTGPPFIDSVSRLIALLLDYRSVSGEAPYKARRMGCMLNLLNFYREIEKDELYIRYIYKLAELHSEDQSFSEAGFTLLLHARSLQWSGELVEAVGTYPMQPSRKRKEELYLECIQLFDQGKSWESGIPLCKELAQLYENEVFDYQKLADILTRQAEFFQKIIRELRVECEYFMVGYYGKGFPLFLRNKVFIHRGQPFEKLQSFLDRLTDEFSTAQIMKTSGISTPDADTQNSSGMHLMVRKVQPISEDRDEFKGKRIPEKILEYYRSNEVRKFQYDRPFHKGEKNRECEFATLWLERTMFTTSKSFPGVISWFQVEHVETVKLNPLDIATETLKSKNHEIQHLTDQYSADRSLNINPLSMLLNGVIDAAVMGGITNYDKIFFNEVYATEHPGDVEAVKNLRALIEEQTALLEKALSLHGQLINPSLQGLHEKLENCFQEFQMMVFPDRRKSFLQSSLHSLSIDSRTHSKGKTSTLARPLPPTPFEFTSSSPNKRASGLQTLPGKIRRATGLPGKLKHSPSLMEERQEPVVKRTPKRSATTKQKTNIFSHSPPGNRKRLSQSSSSENLSVKEEEGSLDSSRQNSSGSVDRLSEEDEGGLGLYERVEDFLGRDPDSTFTPSALASPILRGHRSSSGSVEQDVRASRPAPAYPAPRPPSQSEVLDVDHDYEPVTIQPLTDQGQEAEGRAPLPFMPKRGLVAVGGGRPGAKELEGAPRRESGAVPSPTVTQSSPPRQTPPRGLRPTPPPADDSKSPSKSPERGKPQLPLKQYKLRAEGQPEAVLLAKPASVIDEDVYAFDRLEDTTAVHEDSPKLPLKRRQQMEGGPTTLEATPEHRDDVYFDHLYGPEDERDQAYFDHLFTTPGARATEKKDGPSKPQPYGTQSAQSLDKGSTPEPDTPPPVPVKRSKTVRQVYETPQIRKSTSEVSATEQPRPVPRPRIGTITKKVSEGVPAVVPRTTPPPKDDGDLPPPTLPPKPSAPYLPPKAVKLPPNAPRESSGDGGDGPPPLPQKPANWRSLSIKR